MKTTLEIDDTLYREAKAYASLTGRKMKDLVTEGLRLSLQAAAATQVSGPTTPIKQLAACFAEADRLVHAAQPGPAARRHLGQARNRLERP
ncbi:MAG: type II toxin-antitoxin system VapB family antitoxin [Verrucomicrobia bacterium]|nr:type II toxin-antitoxin system VapB family antitoxin [Verrucomicrobiota bacterium]